MKKTEHVVYMSQILNHTRTVDVKLKDDITKFPTKRTFKGWFLKKKIGNVTAETSSFKRSEIWDFCVNFSLSIF